MTNAISIRRGALASAAVLALLGGPAHAAISVFTTSASFTAGSTLPVTDTFNNVTLEFVPNSTTRTNGPYGYTVTAPGGLYGAGSAADAWLSTSLSGQALTFGGFTGNVRGLGGLFFATDLLGQYLAGQTITLTALDALGATATTTITGATTSSFAGFVSTNSLLVSVTANIADVGGWNTVNNLVLTSASTPVVPEPGTWALLLSGLTLVGSIARRRTSGAG